MADPNLTNYVKSALSEGKAKEKIYAELLGQNWTIEDIQAAFAAANGVVPPVAIPVAPRAPQPAPLYNSTQTASSVTSDVKITDKKSVSPKNGANAIVTIGAILVGVGIFSFIAANWQHMDKPVKLGIIIISMVASYALGWYFQQKGNSPVTAQALFLLGSIIYGAGIFLVAQMFHIRANWPDGFILWMFGTIAMGFAVNSYPLFSVSIILGIVALVGHPFILMGSFAQNSFLLTSSFLLLLATLITFAAGVIIRRKMPVNTI